MGHFTLLLRKQLINSEISIHVISGIVNILMQYYHMSDTLKYESTLSLACK